MSTGTNTGFGPTSSPTFASACYCSSGRANDTTNTSLIVKLLVMWSLVLVYDLLGVEGFLGQVKVITGQLVIITCEVQLPAAARSSTDCTAQ